MALNSKFLLSEVTVLPWLTSKRGVLTKGLNSATTRPKQRLYPLVESWSRALFPPSHMTTGSLPPSGSDHVRTVSDCHWLSEKPSGCQLESSYRERLDLSAWHDHYETGTPSQIVLCTLSQRLNSAPPHSGHTSSAWGRLSHSSGAVWESRWTSWAAVRPDSRAFWFPWT